MGVCEHQFRQDHLPRVAAKLVMIHLVPILAPPVQDGCNLAAQEGGAFGRGEGPGEACKGLALGVLDPPAVAVADQFDGVARARGGDGGQRRITVAKAPSLTLFWVIFRLATRVAICQTTQPSTV